MATKYTRNVDLPDAPPRRRTPWMRQYRPVGRMSRRQALFVIVCFLAAVGLLSQLAARRARLDPFASQPVVRGEGSILHTTPPVNGVGRVGLEIAVEGGKVLAAEWPISSPYWEALTVGDRLTVVYQVHPGGAGLRVLECGIVALPERIR